MNTYCKSLRWVVVFLFVAPVALFLPGASAQSISLTAEQQQLLDQLPPAQREQALRQIEQLKQQGGDGSQLSSLSEETSLLMPTQNDLELAAEPEEPRADRRSRLIVTLDLKQDLEREQLFEFERDEALQRIEGSHYYELDDAGVLDLPGLSSTPLLGLTAEQLELRLRAVAALNIFDITATILESTTTVSMRSSRLGTTCSRRKMVADSSQ